MHLCLLTLVTPFKLRIYACNQGIIESIIPCCALAYYGSCAFIRVLILATPFKLRMYTCNQGIIDSITPCLHQGVIVSIKSIIPCLRVYCWSCAHISMLILEFKLLSILQYTLAIKEL